MDPKDLREKEPFIDLESGTNIVVNEQKRFGNKSLDDKLVSSKERSLENVDAILKEERISPGGDEMPTRKKCSKKPPKPPRPPKAPSLDVADQKLIREITELALLKKARMERMKALKKMRNAKSSSNSSSLCALVFTVIFCFVILWQGISPGIFFKGTSSMGFHGSPESSIGATGGFISVKFYRNDSTNAPHASKSVSPNIVEAESGKDGDVGSSSVVG